MSPEDQPKKGVNASEQASKWLAILNMGKINIYGGDIWKERNAKKKCNKHYYPYLAEDVIKCRPSGKPVTTPQALIIPLPFSSIFICSNFFYNIFFLMLIIYLIRFINKIYQIMNITQSAFGKKKLGCSFFSCSDCLWHPL